MKKTIIVAICMLIFIYAGSRVGTYLEIYRTQSFDARPYIIYRSVFFVLLGVGLHILCNCSEMEKEFGILFVALGILSFAIYAVIFCVQYYAITEFLILGGVALAQGIHIFKKIKELA